MRITQIETVRAEELPNLIWVRLHTDEGLTGLGETFFVTGAVEAYLHDYAAPRLLGQDPSRIDAIARDLTNYVGFRSTGAEMRGNSAVDLALWDLLGKAVNRPVVDLLGGRTRERIRTYNTCAGTHYVRKANAQAVHNWGLDAKAVEYDDLNAFLTRADELAESLLAEGITAMKIWPFDIAAEKTGGTWIAPDDLRRALEPFEKIRKAVGDRMDVMVEFHSMWQLLPAIQIAKALAPYGTFWHEDPIKMDSLGSLRRYAEHSPAPICASETLGSRWAFRDLLETGVAGVVMLDVGWCGGLSEARKVAAMAEAWHLPIAPHDCTGPVVLTASTHLSLNAPNALVQESVRAFYRTWYRDLVTALPPVRDGEITIPEGPGFGIELNPELGRLYTVATRVSALD